MLLSRVRAIPRAAYFTREYYGMSQIYCPENILGHLNNGCHIGCIDGEVTVISDSQVEIQWGVVLDATLHGSSYFEVTELQHFPIETVPIVYLETWLKLHNCLIEFYTPKAVQFYNVAKQGALLEFHDIACGQTDSRHNVYNRSWENTVYHHSENTPYASAFACSLEDKLYCTDLDWKPSDYYMLLQDGDRDKPNSSMGNWWSFVPDSVLIRLGKEFLI